MKKWRSHFFILKTLLGLVFNPQKCSHTFMDWYYTYQGYRPEVKQQVAEMAVNDSGIDVDLYQVEEAEMDEMGRFVGSKKEQRWLWHAIDHVTGMILACVLAPHKDEALVKLVNLLKPFEIKRFFTYAWGAYERILV